MITYFLSGMTTALFLTAAIFFLKFWGASKNRFFGFFAIACGMFALERIVTAGLSTSMPPGVFDHSPLRGWVYVLRLLAFVAIFVAIIDRNRTKLIQRKSTATR